MPRHVEEYLLGPEGLTLSLPEGAVFLGVQRIAACFFLMVDTTDDEVAQETWTISIVRRREYLQSKQKIVGHQVVQNSIMYFTALRQGDEDEPEEIQADSVPEEPSDQNLTPKPAGGMQVL